MGSDGILAGLNDAQREAVAAVRGPVAILAGAGTGKTTTITRRMANQIATGCFEPGQLLGLAFTQKAAREMAARIASLGVAGPRIMTFHAEALAQFRRFSDDQPEILSSKGQILHSIAQRLPPPYRFMPLRDLAGEIEWAKNRRLAARDYLDGLDGHEPPVPPDLMHRIYVNYEVRKRKANLIDFEDLLERVVTLLGSDARALGVVRSRYHAFTVDEYQDVNELQQALLDLWVGARDDVCVVGDDYQSIFGFTGASARHLLRFPGRWDHTTVITLTENHRSTPEVLAIANRLVPGLGGTKKRLAATKETGPAPTLREFETADQEASFIVAKARALHEAGTPWEELAVLYRINGRSEDFEEAFARAGIPFQVRDGSFLSRPAAKAFLARARQADAAAPPADAVPRIAAVLGYDPSGVYEGGEEGTRQADLARLCALAEEFPGDRLDAFVADLRGRFRSDDAARGVHLMTYHRAKGLEFDAVFLPRLEDKELPFALATTPDEVAEERRLLYVGITRARTHLYLSYARQRPGERRTKPRPSPFLRELVDGAGRREASPEPGGGARRSSPRASAPPDTPLVKRLKAWRGAEASRRGLPAYVIMHDATIAAIDERRPETRAELRGVPGVGAVKMREYGDALLSIVAETAPDEEAVGAAG